MVDPSAVQDTAVDDSVETGDSVRTASGPLDVAALVTEYHAELYRYAYRLTGSRPDGTAMAPSGRFGDKTCGNWTSGDKGSAMLGHHDRAGPTGDAWAVSWNSSHPSIGCDLGMLAKTGGAGLFYCFAAD